MIISPISFTNSNNNYVKYNQARYRFKSIQQHNGLSYYRTEQAILAKNCVVFKQKLHPLSYTYNIDATDENISPNFSIEITSVNKFPVKQGLPAIFLFALNDQISEEQQTKKIPYLKLEQTLYKRFANIESNLSNIERDLNIINILINSNIDKKHINSAKKIASTGLFINRKTAITIVSDGWHPAQYKKDQLPQQPTAPKHLQRLIRQNLLPRIQQQRKLQIIHIMQKLN